MQKEIKVVDKEKNIIRITTVDTRHYAIEDKNKDTGLPEFNYLPSVTWICSFYPKGRGFWMWLANQKGWDEAEALKEAAGLKGSKIHQAIEQLLLGQEIQMSGTEINPNTGLQEELSTEEYEAVMAFSDWFNKTNPEILKNESIVISKEFEYAGTTDLVCKIGEDVWIIDLKTGQYIWPEYEIQISAYKQALKEMGMKSEPKLAILQIGYKRNKNKYKFTEIQDKFKLFLAAREIWTEEASKQQPSQKDYPMSIKLLIKKDVGKKVFKRTQKKVK